LKVLRLLPSILMILALGAGCVPALRESPDLQRPAGSMSQSEAEAGYRLAIDLFGSRQEDQVRRAGAVLRETAGVLSEPTEALLALVEVLVWLVEHEEAPNVREDLATKAVHAGQWCLEHVPEDPRCRYRLAIAVGVQGRERPGTGIDAMPTMIELLAAAREAAPDQDHGGPDRVLALLYLRAPGWPAGPGDPDLGYEHALLAVGIAPDFPPNHLVLGEALAAVSREQEAIAAYRTALQLTNMQQESGGRDAREWREEAELALSRLGA
jgi:hypothetical protein